MFSRYTLSSSIHIVNRFAAYFSYCSISSKNSILPNAILNYRLGLQNYKLFLILQLFLEFFFKKLSNLFLSAVLSAFSLNWDGKSTAFFLSCKGLTKLFFAFFHKTFIINLFNLKKNYYFFK